MPLQSPTLPQPAKAVCVVVLFSFVVLAGHAQGKQPAVPARLLDELKSCDTTTREGAIQSLRNSGIDVTPAIPSLAEIVKSDPGARLRQKALEVISSFGQTNDLRNQPNLMEVLKAASESDPDNEVRTAALVLINQYGDSYKRLESILATALAAKNAECGAREQIRDAGQNIQKKIEELTNNPWKKIVWTDDDTYLLKIGREQIPALQLWLKCDVEVQIYAAISVAEASEKIIPELDTLYRKALNREDPSVQEYHKRWVKDAEETQLKAIGDATKLLLEALNSVDDQKQKDVAKGLVQTAKAAKAAKNLNTVDLLALMEQSSIAVAQYGFAQEASEISFAVKSIRETNQQGLIYSFNQLPWWKRTVIGGTAWIGFLFLSSFFLLPATLVTASEKITSNTAVSFQLPAQMGGGIISLHPQDFLLLRLQYSYRVLSAWVMNNLAKAQRNFARNPTVEESAVYVPTGVVFDGVEHPSLQAADLHELFRDDQCRLVIFGDGGTGKTTLAVQIARWAMAPDPMQRICAKQPMIPILLQRDEPDVLKAIRVQLAGITKGTELLSEKLVKALLKRKFLLVVIDGFSELSQNTRASVTNAISDLSINALVVTSRKRETLNDQPRSVIQIKQLQASSTVDFISHYIKLSGKDGLFDEKKDFESAELKLRKITDNRGVPALLAKLYIDQMIAIKETNGGTLPDNIPDLIESNIVTIHHKRDFRTEIVVGNLETIAWECLRHTFTPIHASREAILKALSNEPRSSDLLNYLEEELKVLRVDGNLICFALDPVAEYLAALYLVKHNGNNAQAWKELLASIRQITKPATGTASKLSAVKGFLFALRDSCLTKGKRYLVPADVIASIDELAQRSNVVELAD